MKDAIYKIIRDLGENPRRDGLLETPARYEKALLEMTEGYKQCPREILSKTFAVEKSDIVLVKNINFVSLCEHHLLPFTGQAHVAYIPTNRLVGLSKIPRLVHCFAKRLQCQERLTRQIAGALEDYLETAGVGVVVSAIHSCMVYRGIKQSGATMTTSTMLGDFRKDSDARKELMHLIAF